MKTPTPPVDFNRQWSFAKSDAEWPDDFDARAPAMDPVDLPHTWNADDMVVGRHDPHVGAGWYRKTFPAPQRAPGQRVLLEFEGATNGHKVWVNGGYAGGRNGGFLPTLLDITDFLEDGENTVLVRVDNRYDPLAAMPRNVDWNRYGGITRPVWMRVREHAYLACAGVEIETPEVSQQTARTVVKTHVAETRLSGGCLEVRHVLTAPDGAVVSTTTAPLATRYGLIHTATIELPPVARPQLWSDRSPALYTLRTEVVEDGVLLDWREDRVGYRFFRFDPDDGFVLNGQPTKLRGANLHIFFPGLGNALPERSHREDVALMKRMGCNYLRTSHYPRPKACLDACDELGILVLEEQPYWHGSIRAAGGETAVDNVPRLVRDLVRHHRNHPSIIAWNTVNEVMLAPAYKPGVGHLEPGDPRRAAWSINPKEYPYIRRHLQRMIDTFKEVDPARPVALVVGGAWQKNDDAGLTAMADLVAYNGGALNFAEDFVGPRTGKRYPFRPDYYRELYPGRVHLMSEGVLNAFCYARGEWDREEKAWRQSARYWEAIEARPWFCGGSMWCFTDYSANGELRLHGAVDRYRLPKELFYFYAAMWSDRPVLHILGHWNHEEGCPREVAVFTNCRDVELTLNGRSLGAGVPCAEDYPHIEHPPLVWRDVPFEPGELRATGRAGAHTMTDQRFTAGAPAGIELTASHTALCADGRDIAYVDATVCDADGHRCYTVRDMVQVAVDGAAVRAGPEALELHGGLGRFAVRAAGGPGEITIRAAREGWAAGRLVLESR